MLVRPACGRGEIYYYTSHDRSKDQSGKPGPYDFPGTGIAVYFGEDVIEKIADRISGLAPEAQERLRELAGSKLTADGDILIVASEYRTQEQNRQAARARLKELLARAARPPKHRRPTKTTKGSKQRRLEGKKIRSDIKQSRRRAAD